MPLLPAIQMSRQNRLNHAPFRIVASRFSVLEKGLPSCSTFRPRRISSCMAQIPPCMGAERVRSIQQVDAEEKLCPSNGSKTASNLPPRQTTPTPFTSATPAGQTLQSGDDSGSGRIKGKPPGNPGGSALLEKLLKLYCLVSLAEIYSILHRSATASVLNRDSNHDGSRRQIAHITQLRSQLSSWPQLH